MSATRLPFQFESIDKPRFWNQNVGRRGLSKHPMCFALDDVMNKLKDIPMDQDEDLPNSVACKTLRFLLDCDGKLIFAREGMPTPNKDIPAHCQMSPNGYCVTAGNLMFDENHKLIKITHKSGDFRPSAQSLQFALVKMIDTPAIPFADTVVIEVCTGSQFSEYRFSKAVLSAQLAQLNHDESPVITPPQADSMKRCREDDSTPSSSPAKRYAAASLFNGSSASNVAAAAAAVQHRAYADNQSKRLF